MVKHDALDDFMRMLEQPPPGGRASEAQIEREAEEFVAFAAAFGVTPPSE